MHPVLRFLFTMMFVFLSGVVASAHEYEEGNLLIEHPHIPEPVKASPVAAGYLEIHNKGSVDEVLLEVLSEFSERSQIHTMVVVDDVARMRPITDGVVIPAGGKVKLEQGGNHLMFMRLSDKLEEGQLKNVVLRFKNAGDIKIGMIVVNPDDLDEKQVDHSQHDHSNHTNHN